MLHLKKFQICLKLAKSVSHFARRPWYVYCLWRRKIDIKALSSCEVESGCESISSACLFIYFCLSAFISVFLTGWNPVKFDSDDLYENLSLKSKFG